jgi:hypothetical protein
MTSDEIRKELKAIWPKLSRNKKAIMLPWDKSFDAVETEVVVKINQELIAEWNKKYPPELTIDEIFSGKRNNPEWLDCDDWARELWNRVKNHYRDQKKNACIGIYVFDEKPNHMKVIFWLDRFYVIEPQTALVTDPDKGEDTWFVEI